MRRVDSGEPWPDPAETCHRCGVPTNPARDRILGDYCSERCLSAEERTEWCVYAPVEYVD